MLSLQNERKKSKKSSRQRLVRRRRRTDSDCLSESEVSCAARDVRVDSDLSEGHINSIFALQLAGREMLAVYHSGC